MEQNEDRCGVQDSWRNNGIICASRHRIVEFYSIHHDEVEDDCIRNQRVEKVRFGLVRCSRHNIMSFSEDKNSDSPPSQKDQDDLAMFELSPSPSTCKEEQPIYVDYGFSDSDDDSDVIIIDTTPTILAEKISADCDSIRGAQVYSKRANRRHIEETAKRTIPKAIIDTVAGNVEQIKRPFDKQNNISFSGAKKKKDRKSELNYKSVFEGCNVFEPIEIDDDGDNDGGNCNLEDGKSENSSKENNHRKSFTESSIMTKSTTISTKLSRKAGPLMLEKEEDKIVQSHRKKIRKNGYNDDGINLRISSEKHTNEVRNGKTTNSAISTASRAGSSGKVGFLESNSNSDAEIETGNSSESVVQTTGVENGQNIGDDDATVSRRTIEVIDLADNDDDCSNQRKEAALFINRKRHGYTHGQRPRRTCETKQTEIEIIDVDEIGDIIECEGKHDKEYIKEGGFDTKAKGASNGISTKPRFKPNINKSVRKSEKESIRTFRSMLRRHEERQREKATPHRGIDYDFTQNDGDGGEKIRPDLYPDRKFSSFTENRYIFHPSNGKPENHHSNSFLGMNIEYARKEQERLLQKAAHRVRNQPAFRVTNGPIRSNKVACSLTFATVVRDVHLQYPDHFKYRDFYSRLGLPRNANEATIKSQYKRLARLYHPDRNIGNPDTKHKFQAVTEAYNHVMNVR